MEIVQPTDRKPVPLAHEAIHTTALEIASRLDRGRILDVPAGEGAIAVELRKLGFDVICGDLYPEIFVATDIDIHRADLDGDLPFVDYEFDHVVCVEGLEHISNPDNAIAEFSRVIRRDGTLIVSVPNIMNIEERLKWLLFGYTSHFKPLSKDNRETIEREFPGMSEIALHVNPIGYSEMRYLLEKHGFELKKVHMDRRKKNSWAFFPITGLIRLLNKTIAVRRRRERWADELCSDEVLTGGNTLIFEATKK